MTKQESIPACPLCTGKATKPFHRDRKREFFHCLECDLVFVPPEFHLLPEAEKERYEFHSHSLAESGYRDFLNRLFQPLEQKLKQYPPRLSPRSSHPSEGGDLQQSPPPEGCPKGGVGLNITPLQSLSAPMPGAHGLDFGCGREPTLSVLFEEAGFPCANYDLYYFNNPAVLEKQYDFLTCSETIEHFRNPCEEFERFLQLVKPGGWIGIMTQLRDSAPPFERWFYKDDATHVCFFSRQSFQWLSTACSRKRVTREKTCDLHVEFHPDGVVLFHVPGK
jgi:hypothetical protein